MKRLIATIVFAVLAMSGVAGASKLEDKANKIMKQLYGPCFKPIYSGSLKKASVVRTSTAIKGVVTVQVFLTTIATGKSTTYEFRVNTSTTFAGPPDPGTGMPLNSAATKLVVNCPV